MTAPSLTAYVSGQGSVSADGLNTFEQTCDTYAQLRGLIGLPGMQVYVRSAVAIGDGGAGSFYWNATTTGPDDNATLLMPYGQILGGWSRLGYDSVANATYLYQVPASGFTIQIPAQVGTLVLNPAATLATGAVALPASPFDGQTVTIATSQTITSLALTATGAAVYGSVTTLAGGRGVRYLYVAPATSWFRVN